MRDARRPIVYPTARLDPHRVDTLGNRERARDDVLEIRHPERIEASIKALRNVPDADHQQLGDCGSVQTNSRTEVSARGTTVTVVPRAITAGQVAPRARPRLC